MVVEAFEISEIVSLMSEYSSSVDGDAKPEVVVEDIVGALEYLYSYLSQGDIRYVEINCGTCIIRNPNQFNPGSSLDSIGGIYPRA